MTKGERSHNTGMPWSGPLILYTLVLVVVLPLMVVYLLKRSRKQPEYLQGWGQRFWAWMPRLAPAPHRVWVHAVSVGETHAVSPLVRAFAALQPNTQWVFSSTTPTGQATARQLFSDLPGATFVFLPYDLPVLVRRCVRRLQAEQLWLVETELWPHLLRLAPGLGTAVHLLNARVSPRTARRLQRFEGLSRPALTQLKTIVCQTQADAAVFEALGRPVDAVVGNLKFDVTIKPELTAFGACWKQELRKPHVLLFASSREGEEVLLMQALKATQFFKRMPQWAVWVVPRHPQRCEAVWALLNEQADALDLNEPVRRSSWGAVGQISADLAQELAYGGVPELVLGDSMGEMPAYYTVADVALLGGSWLPLGGQNLIEACACACPVWMGPHTFNFEKPAEDALQAGAGLRFQDLTAALNALLDMPLEDLRAQRAHALSYAAQHKGATEATLAALGMARGGQTNQ